MEIYTLNTSAEWRRYDHTQS